MHQRAEKLLKQIPGGIAINFVEATAKADDGLLWPLALVHQPAAKDLHLISFILGTVNHCAKLLAHVFALVQRGKVVEFNERLPNGADRDARVVYPLDRMRIGLLAKGKLARGIFTTVTASWAAWIASRGLLRTQNQIAPPIALRISRRIGMVKSFA